jgi:hypothetical protein
MSCMRVVCVRPGVAMHIATRLMVHPDGSIGVFCKAGLFRKTV